MSFFYNLLSADTEITPINVQPAYLERWLEAGKETSFADGALMSQITDWSGKGKNITASGGNRATYKTNIVNGKAVVRCVGASVYDSIGGKADDNFKHQGDFTSIKVIRSNVDNAIHYFFDNNTDTTTNIGFSSMFRPAFSGTIAGYRSKVHNGTATAYLDLHLPNTAEGNPAPNIDGNPPVPKNVWLVIVERVGGSLQYQSLEIEVNNILRGWANKSGSRSGATSTNNPKWFALADGTSKGNFDLAFLAEWSTYLTDSELRSLIGRTL